MANRVIRLKNLLFSINVDGRSIFLKDFFHCRKLKKKSLYLVFIYRECPHRAAYRQGHINPISVPATYLPSHFLPSAILQSHQVEAKDAHCAGCMASLSEGQLLVWKTLDRQRRRQSKHSSIELNDTQNRWGFWKKKLTDFFLCHIHRMRHLPFSKQRVWFLWL